MKIAAAHPGKMGDALYTLPTICWLASKYKTTIDFYTSEYCAPLRSLFEHQSYINSFNVIHHEISNYGLGIQPPKMNVPRMYDKVYQLGFTRVPDRFLSDFIARSAGVPENLLIDYEINYNPYPDIHIIAPRGITAYTEYFNDLAEALIRKDETVWVIGSANDYQGVGINNTGLCFLDTAKIIAKAKSFHGLMSSQLVLANGFYDLIKVIPHDGKSWDMRHVLYTDNHHYLINPTVKQTLDILGVNNE